MSAVLDERADPGKAASAALAALVHIALAILLVYGIRWQTRSPEAVEVELVRAVPSPPAPAAVAPPAPEPVPPPKVEPKPEPKVEPKPEPDKASRQLMADALKRDSARIEARKAEQELAAIKAAQSASARSKATADYIGKIKGKIKGNLMLPPDIRGNPEAVFDVVQLPSGEILSVKLKKSSGHAAYDSAIERAILKSSPLPKPEQGDLFSRALELKFRPLEE